MTFADEYFKRDIATHAMQVIRDDGVNRHLRFKRPNTMCMHFDLVTWPGYLCYTGDMGTYVFSRLLDMFQFFRKPENHPGYQFDRAYWAEKIQAQDRDGVKVYSADLFRATIEDCLKSYCDDMTESQRAALKEEVDNEVLYHADDGQHDAFRAAIDFTHDGRSVFQDFWEHDCREYTHRFQWCCHALEWAIAQYDVSKAASTAPVADLHE